LNGQGSDHVKTNGHTSKEQMLITPQNDITVLRMWWHVLW